MIIKKALILEIGIPFKFTFRHALAARNRGKGILVRLEDGEGRTGWGESAPRDYVTGETTESVIAALEASLAPMVMNKPYQEFDEVTADVAGILESLPRNHCRPGDVIIGTLGDPNLRACVVPDDLPESLNKADCLLLRANKRLADPAYISWVNSTVMA